MNMEKIPGNSDTRSQEEGKHQYDACLFFPPLNLQFKFHELGIPQLTSYLRKSGCKVRQKDLNIEFIRTCLDSRIEPLLLLNNIHERKDKAQEMVIYLKELMQQGLKNVVVTNTRLIVYLKDKLPELAIEGVSNA